MRRFAVALLVAGLAVLLASWPAVAAGESTTPVGRGWLEMTLTSQQPRIVTASDTSVTVSGSITNISDRPLRQITARLQVGDPVTSTSALRSGLASTASYGHGDTQFVPIPGTLAQGQSMSFTVSADLQGAHSLLVTRPGVYPLQVNVQGWPDYSAVAYRLGVASMLLPVLAAPGGTSAVPAASPARLTVLWPLIDQQPRIIGSDNGQLVLSDDSLATSLGSGGRLFGLVDAVRRAAAGNQALLSALCFAVDPDLLLTVQGMAGGYRVSTAAGTQPGAGAAAAGAWLATLKNLATAGHCVLALPYADADLAALAHAGGTSLEQLALTDGLTAVRSLGGDTLTSVAWPADNSLDTRTMTDLAGFGTRTVLLNPDSVTPQASGPAALAGFTGGNAPVVVPIDPVTSTALSARTDEPNVDAQAISAQDGLATLVYQTVFNHRGGAVLVAPPRRWSPSPDEALEFLQATATVLAGHYAAATSLSEAVSAPLAGGPVTPGRDGREATLNYPPQESLAEVAHPVVAGAVRSDAAARDMLAAMGRDRTTPTPVSPSALIEPLRVNLVRAASSAWRDGRTAGAQAALDVADGQFGVLRDQVTVVQPGLPILLGSKSSRLPVTVSNKLSVDIAVRVTVSGDPGLPATGVDRVIPAGSSVTVFIPTTVTRTGRLSIYATVFTQGGTELGQQARLELVSSAYGTIIVIVTVIAFGLLVLLSGRRIYRRVRAARGAGPDAPDDPATSGDAAALVGAGAVENPHSETGEPGRQ